MFGKEVILKKDIEAAVRAMEAKYRDLPVSAGNDYKAGYYDGIREFAKVLRAVTPIMKTTDDFLNGFNTGIKIDPMSGA